jgi:eukaryotic-like serine/threonine-protein kinase
MSSAQRRLAGRYVLEEPIGQGGMGEVWRGTDTVLGREVAVKTIDLRRVPDETGTARFEREARATAGLSHPGVVTVHDSGVEGDTAYIVMELLPGPSLADRIANGPVPIDEVVEVGQQVASALDAAHARGLVHRDIKPANIAYAGDGRVRVLDFGITQLGETPGSQALTATHTVMGTAEYLAPEQAMGGRVDGRADLYALGCVLYALLAGRPPFRGPTPVATMMMHGQDAVPDVRGLRPETPDWLADLVHGLLAKDPADRPAGAASVAAALAARESLAGAATAVLPVAGAAAATQRLDPVSAPVTAPSALPVDPDPRNEGRDRSAVAWVLGLVALAALALLAWQQFGSGDDPGPAASASPSATASTPQQETTEPPPTTASPTPTPTPSTTEPSPTPTADPADAVRDATAALSAAIGDLQDAEALDRDPAKNLDDRIRDVEKELRDGNADGVVEKSRDVADELAKGVEEGDISEAAAAVLDPLVDDLLAAADDFRG